VRLVVDVAKEAPRGLLEDGQLQVQRVLRDVGVVARQQGQVALLRQGRSPQPQHDRIDDVNDVRLETVEFAAQPGTRKAEEQLRVPRPER